MGVVNEDLDDFALDAAVMLERLPDAPSSAHVRAEFDKSRGSKVDRSREDANGAYNFSGCASN